MRLNTAEAIAAALQRRPITPLRLEKAKLRAQQAGIPWVDVERLLGVERTNAS